MGGWGGGWVGGLPPIPLTKKSLGNLSKTTQLILSAKGMYIIYICIVYKVYLCVNICCFVNVFVKIGVCKGQRFIENTTKRGMVSKANGL